MSKQFKKATFGKGWISLEHLKLYPASKRTKEWLSLSRVRIYSMEHQAYWGPNRSGYYTDGLAAGVYTFADAYEATNHCGPEKGITFRSETYFQ